MGFVLAAQVKYPVTQGIRFLRAAKVNYTPYLYAYEDRGGTEVAARELGLDEHATIKTLILEDENGTPLIVIMHGDKEVSTKELARVIGGENHQTMRTGDCNQTQWIMWWAGSRPLAPAGKCRCTWKQQFLICPRSTLMGEKRFLVEINPQDLVELLEPELVRVGI